MIGVPGRSNGRITRSFASKKKTRDEGTKPRKSLKRKASFNREEPVDVKSKRVPNVSQVKITEFVLPVEEISAMEESLITEKLAPFDEPLHRDQTEIVKDPSGPLPGDVIDPIEDLYRDTEALLNGEFLLPNSYDTVYSLYTALLSSLLYHATRSTRNLHVSFEDAKKSVEISCKKEFTQKRLAQILSVDDSLIQLKWIETSKDTGHIAFTLDCIRFALTESQSTNKFISDRTKHFKSLLYHKVQTAHKKFLQSIGKLELLPYLRNWHPDFELNKMDPLPLCNLPQPKAKTKSSILSQMLDHVESKLKSHEVEHGEAGNTKVPKVLEHVDTELLHRVRQRQHEVKRRDHVMGSTQDRQLRCDLGDLPDLLIQVRQLFVSQKKKRLRWEILKEQLSRIPGKNVRPGEMEKKMNMLIQCVPHVCSKKTVGKTTVFLWDTNVDIQESLGLLRNLSFEQFKQIVQ